MDWCCAGFKVHYEASGERGFAVLIAPSYDGSSVDFVVQCRAVELGQNPAISSPVPISLVSEARINYCPWCGVDLQGHYGPLLAGLKLSSLGIQLR